MTYTPEDVFEAVERVRGMVYDDCDTWDLSDNDRAALAIVLSQRDALLAALKDVVASAVPHPTEHRAMYAAWINARAAIAAAEGLTHGEAR